MTPGRSARLFLALTLALAIAALPAGCSSYVRSVSPAIWQKQIQAYIAAANGDIHALRDVEVSPGQPGFRLYSHDRPEESKDVAGILVGAASSGNRLWYLYLVGQIDREELTATHLAAVSQPPDSDRLTWRIAADDPAATAAYRAHRLDAWQARRAAEAHAAAAGNPGQTAAPTDPGLPSAAANPADPSDAPPRGALTFPGPGDRYTWHADGDIVTVLEQASGATWKLDLSADAARPPARPQQRDPNVD